jgi:hypothetical protein
MSYNSLSYNMQDLERADLKVLSETEYGVMSKFLSLLHSIRCTLIRAALVFPTQSAIENLLEFAERALGNLCD